MAPRSDDRSSPWRRIFETVRSEVGTQRDADGMLGSINWLRKRMEARGANPNVVRNIIYRDKGKLADKRILFEILNELWIGQGHGPLKAPELEVLLSPGNSAEQEVLRLLGREKRHAFRSFVSSVRSGDHPKLLVTGRPGSGKTLLTDYIQRALELAPEVERDPVRLEFSSTDLATALSRLAAALGVPADLLESRLVKIGGSGAYAVQADAQADVARAILDAARSGPGLVLLAHVSQSLTGRDSLGMAPLRLNTPEVPRVSASEWLWLSLFEPLARLPRVSVLVSMADVPARAMQRLGSFEGPIKLTPPSTSEARRFVRARLPQLSAAQQGEIVARAGRSFEELRTLTLLAEIREPGDAPLAGDGTGGGGNGAGSDVGGEAGSDDPVRQLSRLVQNASDARLRAFLAALAVLSVPEFPYFDPALLQRLREDDETLTSIESAFLDSVPGSGDEVRIRCFSRQLARSLRAQLLAGDPGRYRALHLRASALYRAAAETDPKGEGAARFLEHLFEARAWDELVGWLEHHPAPQSLVRRVWQAAQEELDPGPILDRVARRIAGHYVKLGSFRHRDAEAAFAVLADADDPELRTWTHLKRAEGEVLRGRFDHAEALLAESSPPPTPTLRAEAALVRASVERWRSDLGAAAALVADGAQPQLEHLGDAAAERLLRDRVGLWSGLIAKDRGDLERAAERFAAIRSEDDLIAARVAFQSGDVALKLGRFEVALRELDRAVALSQRSEALVQEQTRYLTRRGTLQRRRGDLAAAERDVDAARAILARAAGDALERDFWRARIEDEAALALLAQGRADRAIQQLHGNLGAFRRYADAHDINADYRIRRTTVYLALAYGCRALALRFGPPHIGLPDASLRLADLDHARRLLDEVFTALERPTDTEPRRDDALRRAALLAAARLHGGDVARARCEAALELARFPFHRAQAHAHAAALALRDGDLERCREALEEATRASETARHDDLGLDAWIESLGAERALLAGDVEGAGEALAALLASGAPAPFLEAALRAFGTRAEARPPGRLPSRLAAVLELPADGDPAGAVRLPDALVARWREIGRRGSDSNVDAPRDPQTADVRARAPA